MKIDNYEYSEEYEKEVEGIAGKLNFSDTKIIAGFNNKVADYKRQYRTITDILEEMLLSGLIKKRRICLI